MPKVAARSRGGKGLGGRGRGVRRGRGGRGGRARMSSAKPPEASMMEEEEEDEGDDLEEHEAAEGPQSDAGDNVVDPAGWMDAADEGGEGDGENMDDYSHYYPGSRGPPPGYFRDHPMHAHRGFGPSYYPHGYPPPYNQPPYHPPTSDHV
uniref:Uncharacterized protein n=1 Tax=Chromera velia CCMP2878 TaxID=1169474 RepID=A0A0G4HYN6_9ALVE|eukprot:Cvel_9519.t1-p1 / transcript=Cvel_9519.t1 / gene=Cvel_9519 / organism=Chromera_velia_CCMP2878 / gene_product=hypothetical protein / transcript_product=hypothetical protein / location=Cvel_scaffold551:25813-26259(+) / protein_length=149 / sequence_SO=supercontig / SO=protein_coding / is_pseudo=false